MTYPDQQTHTEPAAPKGRAIPWLIAAVVALVLGVTALSFVLIQRSGDEGPAAAADPGAVFTKVRDDCSVVAGYAVEDEGRTLVMTAGNQFMNTDTMTCVFDRLGVPSAVREHVSSTRALDGQQTDSWTGYAARWTYHPDAGLKMTIQVA